MNQIKHLLVIRLSAMGDVAMTVPVLANFQKQHPNVQVTILTRGLFAPMFAQLENVIVYEAKVRTDHKGFKGLWRLYRELKQLNIDAVADLHNVLRSTVLKYFFRWGGTPFVQIDKGRKEKKALTALRPKELTALKTTHERYAEVFAQLGLSVTLDANTVLQKEALSEAAIKVIGRNVQKWVGIAPFAAFEGKQYPLESMQRVLEMLKNADKYKIILFGGGEKEKALLKGMAERYNCISMVGRFPFNEELALISNLDIMLAMDSGNAHLAAMYGIPVVTLWGITHPYAGFYPFGQDAENALLADRSQFPFIPTSVYGNKAPAGYQKAIASIKPKAIVAKLETVLENERKR